jgi:gliding motility-associated-like protein
MKHYLVNSLSTIVFSFCIINCNAQTWLWARQPDLTNASAIEGTPVMADNSGNLYNWQTYTLFSVKFGSLVVNNKGVQNSYIVKYDPKGNPILAINVGGKRNDGISKLVIDDSNNVIVSGACGSDTCWLGSYPIVKLTKDTTKYDAFLAKMDSNGLVLWSRVDSSVDAGIIKTDKYNNIYWISDFTSNVYHYDGYTLVSYYPGSYQPYAVKFNPAGKVIWFKYTCFSKVGAPGLLAVDKPTSQFYVAGLFTKGSLIFGKDTITSTVSGYYHNFLAKFDSSGNELWAEQPSTSYPYNINDIATDGPGNIYLAGHYYRSLAFSKDVFSNTDGSGKMQDFFIAKFNKDGTENWAKSYGQPDQSESAWSLSYDVRGYMWLSGDFFNAALTGHYPNYKLGFGKDTLYGPPGSSDPAFVVAFDSIGNTYCKTLLATGGDDENYISVVPSDSGSEANTLYFGGDCETASLVAGDSIHAVTPEPPFFAKYKTCSTMIIKSPDSLYFTYYINCDSLNFIAGSNDSLINHWYWNLGDGTSDTGKNVTHIYQGAGSFTVLLHTDTSIINDTVKTIVNLPIPPILKVSNDTSICNDVSVNLFASGGNSYIWSPSAGLNNDHASDPVANPQITTTYIVTATDSNNCIAKDSVKITVKDCPPDTTKPTSFSLDVPTAFSPNGDGVNDVLYVRGTNISSIDFSIYNRYGSRVFSTNNINIGWDGTYKGEKQPVETYAYTLKAITIAGKEILKKGYVILLR